MQGGGYPSQEGHHPERAEQPAERHRGCQDYPTGSRKREEELDYDIDLPAAPPPPNPFRVFPVANIHPVIGKLARRERWLLAPPADTF